MSELYSSFAFESTSLLFFSSFAIVVVGAVVYSLYKDMNIIFEQHRRQDKSREKEEKNHNLMNNDDDSVHIQYYIHWKRVYYTLCVVHWKKQQQQK